MKRRERLVTPAAKVATALGFALGAISADDPHFRDALGVGFTNALRSHAAGTLTPEARRRAVAAFIDVCDAVHPPASAKRTKKRAAP